MDANDGSGEATAPKPSRVFISYKRGAEPDRLIASLLHEYLATHGHNVFIDIEIAPGSDWSELIASKITDSDFFVVLLSKASVLHGYVVAETVMARDREAEAGHPKILPIRLAYDDDLPLRLGGAIGHLQHFEWRDPADNDPLVVTLLEAIGQTDEEPGAKPSSLSRGDHFIVTASVWQAAGSRESLAGTTIVPVRAGQETSLAVTRAKAPGFFQLKVLDDGALEVAIWKGTQYRGVESRPRQFVSMIEGDSHSWCFARYAPDECIVLKRPDGRKDPVVVTFDPDVVRAAWMITHERGATHESFLIVMKDSMTR